MGTISFVEFLKTIFGKLVTGAVGLAVIAAPLPSWRTGQSTRQMLLGGTGKIIAWLGIVILIPWVTFFLTTWAARKESNVAGALLVACYTLPEWALLAWMFNWRIPGATAWTFLVVGMLFAAAY